MVELDGASFGREATGKGRHPKPREQAELPNTEVLIAIESKPFVDERGRPKEKAGFAKVTVSRETTIFAQRFVERAMMPGTLVNADASNSFKNLRGVDVDQ